VGRRRVLVVGGCLVLVVALLVGWLVLRPDETEAAAPELPFGVTEGPVSVRWSEGAFADGDTPTIELDESSDDAFLTAFSPGGTPSVVADVQSKAQPKKAVEVAFRIDVDALPDDAVPAVFYFDEATELWLPVPSRLDEQTGELVGTTEHFTLFGWSLTTIVQKAEQGAQWLRYQTARATSSRADPPTCRGGVPTWVSRTDKDAGLNEPLPACVATTSDGSLELHVVVNRGYSFELSGPRPRSVEYQPSVDTAALLYQTLAKNFTPTGKDRIWLPARVETVLVYPQGSLPVGEVTLSAKATPPTAVMDTVVAAGEFLMGRIPSAITAIVGMVDCLENVVQTAGSDISRVLGTLVEATASCADSVITAAGAAGKAAAQSLTKGLQAGFLAGRAGQAALDAAMAWQEPADVRLRVRPVACGVDLKSRTITAAIRNLKVVVAGDPGYAWSTDYIEGNFDPCATLSAVDVSITGATGSSPMQVLLFSKGRYVGTATKAAYASSYVDADASTDDTVVVEYLYAQPWDASTAGRTGHARIRYHWTGSKVERLDELPEQMTDPQDTVTISLSGFGPFAWGDSRAEAEAALSNPFALQDLGNGCAQARLDWPFSPTFAVQDGVMAAAAVSDEWVVTDTGIAVGDPVSEIEAAYPDVVASPDPSDAFSTRYEVQRNGRTAQFISTDGATVGYMQLGLSSSVGEAPCV
jgi:hypothetical protein